MKTFDKVRDIVAKQLFVEAATIDEKTTFFDVDADSLDVVEVILAVEQTFDIDLPDEEVESLKTVGGLATFVETALKSK